MIVCLVVSQWTATAGPGSYASLNDAQKLSIRLKSYLLISAQDYADETIRASIPANIPLAIDARDGQIPELKSGSQSEIIPLLLNDTNKTQVNAPFCPIFPDDTNQLLPLENDSLTLAQLPSFCKHDLLIIDLNRKETSPDFLLDVWNARGKMPNFLKCEKENIAATAVLVNELNEQKKIFGIIHTEQGPLSHVLLKDFPGREINGFFCFPVIGKAIIRPYKAGYQFSPDVIYHSPENERNMKIFNAIPFEPDYGLTDYFRFRNKVSNIRAESDKEIITQQVKFTRDKQMGPVACFNRSYIDAGLESKTVLNSVFSICVWIKPTMLSRNNSILGKGTNFILKLHDGKLTFTMAGVKDYISQKSIVPLNQWTHVAVVYSQLENKIRFYLNGEMTEEIKLISNYIASDHTLLIGSNLWEEFFVGYIREVKIWDRELNEDEVKTQFEQGQKPESSGFSGIILAGSFILIAVIAMTTAYRKRQKKEEQTEEPDTIPAEDIKPLVLQNNDLHEKIICFGGLKVFNAEGIEIGVKFAPKIRQLFILVFLHSVGDEKGISTNKLSEILWPGMSPQTAKNTRGTNIQNLKAALSACTGINLVFREKLWALDLATDCYSDYPEVLRKLQLLEHNNDIRIIERELPSLLSILKRGTLFANMSESWLDPYISQLSDRIIEFGLRCFELLDENKHASLILEMAEVISLNDPLNEPALRKKLHLLTKQGKLSLARSAYDRFAKLYHELYQEEYSTEFKSLN